MSHEAGAHHRYVRGGEVQRRRGTDPPRIHRCRSRRPGLVSSRLGRLDDQADGSAVEWLWREDRVAELLSSDTEVVFVAGCAANQGTFRTRFDCMILLTVSEEVTLGRLARRTTNTYGKTGKERARILSDKAHVEPRLRDSAHVVIDTDAPLGAVVDELLAVALS